MSAVKAERYAANEGYGEDFLGLVPKPWLVSRLKDKATFNPSKSEIKELPKECTFAPMEKLKTDSLLTDVTVIPSNISGSYTYFRENDLLIAKVTPCFENRNVAIAKNLTNGIGFGSSEINVVRVSKKANQRWFFYLFLSSGFIEAGASKMAGAGGLKRIPSIFLETFAFALPPLSEQTAIAAYLDTKTAQIDRQIDLLSQKATQYGKLKRSLINETVTRGLDKAVPMKDSGVICIGLIPRHWKKLRLKDLGTIETSSIDKKTIENEKLVKLVNYSDIYGNLKKEIFNQVGYMIVSANAKQIKDKNLNQGDVLFTPSSETYEDIGVSSVVMENLIDTLYSYHILRLRFHKKIELNFKKYLFNNNYVQTYFSQSAKGTTRKILGLTQFNNLELVFPPAYKEQKEIAAYLDHKTTQIDRIINVIGSQIDKLKDLRKALINDVVTGKIKVVSGGIAV